MAPRELKTCYCRKSLMGSREAMESDAPVTGCPIAPRRDGGFEVECVGSVPLPPRHGTTRFSGRRATLEWSSCRCRLIVIVKQKFLLLPPLARRRSRTWTWTAAGAAALNDIPRPSADVFPFLSPSPPSHIGCNEPHNRSRTRHEVCPSAPLGHAAVY